MTTLHARAAKVANENTEKFALMESALVAIRKAAGSSDRWTNRLQFIYERAGQALLGEAWSEEWKAQYGYKQRNRILLENDELKARIADLDAALTRAEKEIELLMQEPGQDALRECRQKALEEAAAECLRVWKDAPNTREDGFTQNTISHGCSASAAAIRVLAQTEAGEDTP